MMMKKHGQRAPLLKGSDSGKFLSGAVLLPFRHPSWMGASTETWGAHGMDQREFRLANSPNSAVLALSGARFKITYFCEPHASMFLLASAPTKTSAVYVCT